MTGLTEKLKFKIHGNYGGPNYTGGKHLGKGESGDFNVPASDRLDEIYRKHDYDYSKIDHGKADKLLLKRLGDYKAESPMNWIKAKASQVGFKLKSLGSREPDSVPEYPWEGLKKNTGNTKRSPKLQNSNPGSTFMPGKKGKRKLTEEQRKRRNQKRKERRRKRRSGNNGGGMAKNHQKTSAAPMAPRPKKINSSLAGPTVVSSAPDADAFRFKNSTRKTSRVTATYNPGQIAMFTTDVRGLIYYNLPLNPNLFYGTRAYSESMLYERYKIRSRLCYRASCGSTQEGTFATIFDEDVTESYPPGNFVAPPQITENAYNQIFPAYSPKMIYSKWTNWQKEWLWCPGSGQSTINYAVDDPKSRTGGQWVIMAYDPTNTQKVTGDIMMEVDIMYADNISEGLYPGLQIVTTANSNAPWVNNNAFAPPVGTTPGGYTAAGPFASTNPMLGFTPDVSTVGKLNGNLPGFFFMFIVQTSAAAVITVTPSNWNVTNVNASSNGASDTTKIVTITKLTPASIAGSLTISSSVASTSKWRIYIFPVSGGNIAGLFEPAPPSQETKLLTILKGINASKLKKLLDSVADDDVDENKSSKEEIPDIEIMPDSTPPVNSDQEAVRKYRQQIMVEYMKTGSNTPFNVWAKAKYPGIDFTVSPKNLLA